MDQKIIKIHVTADPSAIEAGIYTVSAGAVDAHNKESDYPYRDYSLKSCFVVALKTSEDQYKKLCHCDTIEDAKERINSTEKQEIRELLTIHRGCLIFDQEVIDEAKC